MLSQNEAEKSSTLTFLSSDQTEINEAINKGPAELLHFVLDLEMERQFMTDLYVVGGIIYQNCMADMASSMRLLIASSGNEYSTQ